jgi:hypothetical protein
VELLQVLLPLLYNESRSLPGIIFVRTWGTTHSLGLSSATIEREWGSGCGLYARSTGLNARDT